MARPTSRTRATTAEPAKGRRLGEAIRGKAVGLGILVLIVAGVVALVAFDEPLPGTEFASLGNQHIPTVDTPHSGYNSSPPSSGPHLGALAPWGVSEEPLPPELFVHNLEDGGIVLAHDCPAGCADLVEGLASFTDRGRVLVTPYSGIVDPDGMPHRGAAVAWNRVFYFDELDAETRDEIGAFISLYEGVDHHVGAN